MTAYVRMGETLKKHLLQAGQPSHIEEFGHCLGEVVRPLAGDVIEVCWLPSNIRFAYLTTDVESVKPDNNGHILERCKIDEFDGFVCQICDEWVEAK